MSSAFLAGFLTLIVAAGATNSDEQIKQTVESKLEDEGLLEGDVRVSVKAGVVYLEGTLPNVWSKQKALDIALGMPEVQAVESELTVAAAESDEALTKEIHKKVLQYAFYEIFDEVGVGVKDGIVMLTGRVTMPYKADQIGEMVARIFGVQEVINDIATLPVSINDTRLRGAISRRIYGDSMFHDYSFWANPPIHIIVEGGRVTLIGQVRSEIEKRKAGTIARSTFGVFGVDNQLRVGSN